jgi:hypothetical protein
MDGNVKLYYKIWTNIYSIEFNSRLQFFEKITQIDLKLYTGSFGPATFEMRFGLLTFGAAILQTNNDIR